MQAEQEKKDHESKQMKFNKKLQLNMYSRKSQLSQQRTPKLLGATTNALLSSCHKSSQEDKVHSVQALRDFYKKIIRKTSNMTQTRSHNSRRREQQYRVKIQKVQRKKCYRAKRRITRSPTKNCN